MMHYLKNDTSDVRCIYDDRFDDLTIKIKASSDFYSDEIAHDVYLVKNEADDDLVAIQILRFLNRSLERLQSLFSPKYYDIICHCKSEIQNRNI